MLQYAFKSVIGCYQCQTENLFYSYISPWPDMALWTSHSTSFLSWAECVKTTDFFLFRIAFNLLLTQDLLFERGAKKKQNLIGVMKPALNEDLSAILLVNANGHKHLK